MNANLQDLNAYISQHFSHVSSVCKRKRGGILRAVQRSSGERVILKIYEGKRGMQQFSNEYKVLKKLSHANCMSLIDYFVMEDHAILVLPLCERGDLFEYLFPEDYQLGTRPLSEKQALRFFVQLTLALEHLHKMHIIHRDVKLENIFLDSNLNVVLGDYGLASSFDPIGRRKRYRTGTLNYTPPESILGTKIRGPEADIWCAGCVLYIMLYGSSPFYGDTDCAIINQVLYNEPEFYSGISSQTQDLLKSLLKKNSTQRPTISQIKRHPAVQDLFRNPEKLAFVIHDGVALTSPRDSPMKKIRSNLLSCDHHTEDCSCKQLPLNDISPAPSQVMSPRVSPRRVSTSQITLCSAVKYCVFGVKYRLMHISSVAS